MQRYTVYFIWKQLYMFREVTPPIIRSAYNCIYSTCYLSHRYCHLPLSWKYSNSSTIDNSIFISGNCSICFGWYHQPSSGAQTTVSTASGICHIVTATCRYRGSMPTPTTDNGIFISGNCSICFG
jgi:hypothetical protein